jgi:hypothetical protein
MPIVWLPLGHSPPCSGGGGNILIPPSVPARKLGDYLRVAIGLHFFLAIFIMIAGRYFDGVFDLLGVLIGYMSIKNREGYSFSCVLSYCVFTGQSNVQRRTERASCHSHCSQVADGPVSFLLTQAWTFSGQFSGAFSSSPACRRRRPAVSPEEGSTGSPSSDTSSDRSSTSSHASVQQILSETSPRSRWFVLADFTRCTVFD